MKGTSYAGFWHGVGQALVVALGWLGFGWMWLLVLERPWEVRGLVWLIGGSLVMLPLVTLCWVSHNRSIHRRKGPRRATAAVSEHYWRDWSGLKVQANWPTLRRARNITIHVGIDGKRYGLDAAPAPAPVRRERVLA